MVCVGFVGFLLVDLAGLRFVLLNRFLDEFDGSGFGVIFWGGYYEGYIRVKYVDDGKLREI